MTEAELRAEVIAAEIAKLPSESVELDMAEAVASAW